MRASQRHRTMLHGRWFVSSPARPAAARQTFDQAPSTKLHFWHTSSALRVLETRNLPPLIVAAWMPRPLSTTVRARALAREVAHIFRSPSFVVALTMRCTVRCMSHACKRTLARATETPRSLDAPPPFAAVARFLKSSPAILPVQRDFLLDLLCAFIRTNEDHGVSPNYAAADEPDECDSIFGLLGHWRVADDDKITLACVTALKILSRKRCNRVTFGKPGVCAILKHMAAPHVAASTPALLSGRFSSSFIAATATPPAALAQGTPRSSAAAVMGECANVILNVCYERDNVHVVLRCGGVTPLVRLLRESDQEVIASFMCDATSCMQIQSEPRVFPISSFNMKH